MGREIKQYNVGDPLITTGEKIVQIIGQHAKCGVYITEGKQIRWEWYGDPPTPVVPVSKFERLANLIINTVKQGKRDDLRIALATALRASLCCDIEAEQENAYLQISSRIHSLREKMCKARFLVSGFLVVLLELVLLALLETLGPATTDTYVYCGIWGSVGALMSCVLTSKDMTVELDYPIWYSSIEGVVRVVFGILCGVCACLMVQSNLILGAFSESRESIYLIALSSGFIERLVPNVLMKVSKKSDEGAEQGGAGNS